MSSVSISVWPRRASVLLAVFALAGCAGLGGMSFGEPGGGYGYGGEPGYGGDYGYQQPMGLGMMFGNGGWGDNAGWGGFGGWNEGGDDD